MSNPKAPRILRGNLSEHAAVRAWSELRPPRVEPDCIEIVQQHKKAAIYRLAGVGVDGSAVIAKRCRMRSALIERTIYEEVLPQLPVTALHYYGYIQQDDSVAWLFLEDAGSERFSYESDAHRTLAARWLGLMHTSGACVAAAASLPDGGPRRYLEYLRTARHTLRQNLGNPSFGADDVALLESLLSLSDRLESRWHEVEAYCAGVPTTLVHGDFRPKNIHVRADRAGMCLFALDWETAGWGPPAADLAPSHGDTPLPAVDFSLYWSIIRERWPEMDMQDIRRLENIGQMFRQIAAIYWESPSMAYEQPDWLLKPMWCMKIYESDLSDALAVAGLAT